MNQPLPVYLLLSCCAGPGAAPAADPGSGAPPPPPLTAPGGWRTAAARAEIAPRFFVIEEKDAALLGAAGQGDEAVDGRWIKRTPVAAGKHYRFAARYRAKGVTEEARSVLARVLWFGAGDRQIGTAEYPLTGPTLADGWRELGGIYPAPPEAREAQLELHLRWSARGEVLWRDAELKESAPPPSRKVRLAAVNHRPRGSRSPQESLEAFAALVEEAAKKKADLVCLPEGITVAGSSRTYAEAAEPIPGPSTAFLGEVARKHGLYLVAGLYERDGKAVYNSSVLLDPRGELAGKYRKVCLPREEIDGGITPGKDRPVFDTAVGRVGMMICWDVHFPEVARELGRKGAEVICLPIWGGNETLARARAIENQLYLVASGYDFKTAIYDRTGRELASASRDPEVLVVEVDLARPEVWPWLGDWRARIWREAPEGAER